MERYQVEACSDKEVVFITADDMESAYLQLADGKDIIVFHDKDGVRTSEIKTGKLFSEISDGKFHLFSKEKIR